MKALAVLSSFLAVGSAQEMGRVVHPGQLTLANGWKCELSGQRAQLERDELICATAVRRFYREPEFSPDSMRAMLRANYDYSPGNTMGMRLEEYTIGGKPLTVHVPADDQPQTELKNYVKTVDLAAMMFKEITLDLTAKDVLNTLSVIHMSMTEEIKSASPGKVRGASSSDMIVFYEEDRSSPEEMISILQEKGAKKKTLSFFKKKLEKEGLLGCLQSERCKKIFEWYIGTIKPSGPQVGLQLESFAKEFRDGIIALKSELSFDSVSFAARVHQRLVDIHPFADGNGRTARVLMNAILEMCGNQKVVVLDNDKYMSAIRQDFRHPEEQIFVNYVRSLIAEQTEEVVEAEVSF